MTDLAMILISALVTFIGLLVGSMIVAAGHRERKAFDGRKRVNVELPTS